MASSERKGKSVASPRSAHQSARKPTGRTMMKMNANRIQYFLLALLAYMLIPEVSGRGEDEADLIRMIRKSEYIYLVRRKDARSFVLLDHCGLEKPSANEVKPFLMLKTIDTLYLGGTFGGGCIGYTFPVYQNKVLFPAGAIGNKIPEIDITRVFEKSKVLFKRKSLHRYTAIPQEGPLLKLIRAWCGVKTPAVLQREQAGYGSEPVEVAKSRAP